MEMKTALGYDLANEKTAMALRWLGLAADERDPMILGPGNETLYGLAELRLLGHRAVQCMTLRVIVLFLRRTPSQLVPKKQIPDASFSKSAL
jgi:hypothetical protein